MSARIKAPEICKEAINLRRLQRELWHIAMAYLQSPCKARSQSVDRVSSVDGSKSGCVRIAASVVKTDGMTAGTSLLGDLPAGLTGDTRIRSRDTGRQRCGEQAERGDLCAASERKFHLAAAAAGSSVSREKLLVRRTVWLPARANARFGPYGYSSYPRQPGKCSAAGPRASLKASLITLSNWTASSAASNRVRRKSAHLNSECGVGSFR